MDSYENDANQTWEIKTDCKHLVISFQYFETESDYDFLYIIEDGSSTSFSGTNTGNDHVCKTGNTKLRFESDASETRNGFKLTWKCAMIRERHDKWETKSNKELWDKCPESLIIRNTHYHHHSDVYDDIYDKANGTSSELTLFSAQRSILI